jgi:hypothetical protein
MGRDLAEKVSNWMADASTGNLNTNTGTNEQKVLGQNAEIEKRSPNFILILSVKDCGTKGDNLESKWH